MTDTNTTATSRVVAITGAASGIGLATAQRFAAAGDTVVMLDVDADRLRSEAAALNAASYVLDVRSGDSVTATFAAIASEVGPIDVLVNNAGIGVAADLLSSSWEDWQRTFDVNVHSMFHTCRAALPSMLERGAGIIVNTASVAGLVGIRDRSAYCTSKSAVIGFTRALTADYAHRGIRANAVCPGTVATEWIGKILATAEDPAAKRLAMEQRQLDGQMGSPHEVAAAIFFLASPDGRFANGSAMVIDGGWTAM
ncbi:MAG: SDR family oxidoreductase [Actinomycetota bacterium]|jgi:short-subunit dehydrogenase